MSFDGREGTWYTIEQAAALTHEYQRSAPEGAIFAEFMGKEKLLEILNQFGCEGLRVYYGKDVVTGESRLVFLGADENENDMLLKLAERGTFCPKHCGVSSPLRLD